MKLIQTRTLTLTVLLSLCAYGCVGTVPGESDDPDSVGDSDGDDPGEPPGDGDGPSETEDPPDDLPPCTLSGAIDVSAGLGEGLVDAEGVYYFHTSEDESEGVFVMLYPGYGAFAGGLAAGSYDLTESPDDCGACVGYYSAVGDSGEYYLMASQGTLEITEVTATAGSAFRGTLSEVTFTEVDDLDQPVPGGCSVELDSLSFDVTLVEGSLGDDE